MVSKRRPVKKGPAKRPAKVRTEFTKWNEALACPAQVETLTLDVKQLPRVTFPKSKPLPAEIGTFENLRELEIRARNLKGLCPELAMLTKLESLEIDNSDFALDLGPLVTLPALKTLELYNVGLTKFVPLPKSLESLRLQANARLDIADWCEGLAALPNLHTLSLTQQCGPLPVSIAKLRALRSLTIDWNELCEVPAVVWQLTWLEELSLGLNSLAHLPSQIGELRALKRLALYSNKLSVLPDELCELAKLEALNLSNNPLREVPDWIGKLRSLRDLDLGETPLTDLPPSIFDLRLEELTIDAPINVIDAVRLRMPHCRIVRRSAQDADREVQGWLKFFGKA